MSDPIHRTGLKPGKPRHLSAQEILRQRWWELGLPEPPTLPPDRPVLPRDMMQEARPIPAEFAEAQMARPTADVAARIAEYAPKPTTPIQQYGAPVTPPSSPADPQQAWQGASSIGPAQVGERYLETEAPPSILDLVRQLFLGPARPTTVAAQDPYGIEAWQKGAGPAPIMLGTTEGVGDPGLIDTLKKQFPRFAKALEEFGTMGYTHPPPPAATSPSWSTAQGLLRDVQPPPTAERAKTLADAARNRARVQVRLGEAPTERGDSLLISTRVPTAVAAPRSVPGDPLLLTNLDVVKQDPELVAKFAARIRTYPQLTEREAALGDQGVIDAFMARGQRNLQWLWDQTPKETRERSRLWYVGGNTIGQAMAAETGIQPAQAFAVIASQSPQKEWFNNVEIARRINSGYRELTQVNPVVTPQLWELYGARTLQSNADKLRTLANQEGAGVARELQRRIEAQIAREGQRFVGQRFQDLPLDGQARVLRTISEASTTPHYPIITPEGQNAGLAMVGDNSRPRGLQWNSYDMIENALSVLQDGSAENISRRMGTQHKVRSFFNNLSNPFDPRSLTVDTQQVAATHLQPLSQEAPEVGFVMSGPASAQTGISGANPIYGDIGKGLGEANQIVPAQGQSVVWEAGRGLFKPEQKRSELPGIVRQLWEEFRTGRITEAQFYDHLLNASGGITPPAWQSPK